LESWLDEIIPSTHGALQDILIQLKSRPTFEEQWPDQWRAGLARGKARVLKLETIRNDSYTLSDILSVRPEIQKWYNEIT
jgi:hypothetical protein